MIFRHLNPLRHLDAGALWPAWRSIDRLLSRHLNPLFVPRRSVSDMRKCDILWPNCQR